MSKFHLISYTRYLWSRLGPPLVLWMTSCFHIMGPVGQNQARRHVASSSSNGGIGNEIVVYDFRLTVTCIKTQPAMAI